MSFHDGVGATGRPSLRAPSSPVLPFRSPPRSPPQFAVHALSSSVSARVSHDDQPAMSPSRRSVLSAAGASPRTPSGDDWPLVSVVTDADRESPPFRRGSVASEADYGELEGAENEDDERHGLSTPMLHPDGDASGYPPSPQSPFYTSRRKRRKLCGQGRWVPVAGMLGFLAIAVLLVRSSHLEKVKDYAAARIGWSTLEGADDGALYESEAEAEDVEPVESEPMRPVTGSDGSTILRADGTTFVYKNRHGGSWDASPSGTAARAQSFTPALSEPWDYSKDRIFGVNLGGWLTLEPFISPAIFEPFVDAPTPAVDEWSLSENLGDRLADVLGNHYDTFIVEEDFMRIADAGLNWIRIPLPFWAVDVQDGEPFLAYTAWTYFLKAVDWARKYGLRINLDLHTVPGSQNGWNHSGKMGGTNFLHGVMGLANAQRTLNIIRLLTEFIMQPESTNVIPMFSTINEPLAKDIGAETLRRFYMQAYGVIRNVTGFGVGNGPIITFHDGFVNPALWDGFMDGADRVALDSHFYLAFATANKDAMDIQAMKPCQKWASKFSSTMAHFGLALAGEWSLAVNDCGLFVNGVDGGCRYETAFAADDPETCSEWMDTTTWTEERKQGMQKFAYSYIDTTRNWFFWTWRIGVSLATGKEANPMWSYERGLREGYVPLDPRGGIGFCDSYFTERGARPPRRVFNGKLRPHQTGGVASPTIAAADVQQYGDFPGPTFGDLAVGGLPRLTPTGRPIGFPDPRAVSRGEPTPRPSPRRGQSDWYVPVEGCAYPGGWDGLEVEAPASWCKD